MPEQESEQWEIMQEDLDATSLQRQQRYMFGFGGTLRWTGYTIGFHIMQRYLQNHPNTDVEEWTDKDACDLLAESEYSPDP